GDTATREVGAEEQGRHLVGGADEEVEEGGATRLRHVAAQLTGVAVRAATRAVRVARCSATRSGAVPPTPERLASEPSTVSTSRTSGVRRGSIAAYCSSLGSWSSSPSASQNRTRAPEISCASRNGTPWRTRWSATSVASENPCGA